MKRTLLLLAAALLLPTVGWGKDKPPSTVKQVDLNRYAGLWYEIAKIPNRFQKKCASRATARYAVRSDGRIDVVNSCMEENGDTKIAEGIAKVEDEKSNAKLKVSFVRMLGISMFWGDYWIIGLGDDYEHALVGVPNRKYGWILSRTSSLDQDVLDEIYVTLRQQGYDPNKFEMTPH